MSTPCFSFVAVRFHILCSEFTTVCSVCSLEGAVNPPDLLTSRQRQQSINIMRDFVTINLFVVFGVNAVELRFASAVSATGSGKALPGTEAGEQR